VIEASKSPKRGLGEKRSGKIESLFAGISFKNEFEIVTWA